MLATGFSFARGFRVYMDWDTHIGLNPLSKILDPPSQPCIVAIL